MYIIIIYIYIHMDDNRVGLHLSFYPKARGLLSSTFNRFALLAPASKSILKSCKSPAWLAWLQVELASWLGKKSQKTSLAQLLISFAVPWTKLSLPTYLCSLGPTKSLNPKSKTPTCCYNVKKRQTASSKHHKTLWGQFIIQVIVKTGWILFALVRLGSLTKHARCQSKLHSPESFQEGRWLHRHCLAEATGVSNEGYLISCDVLRFCLSWQ